MSDLTTIYVGVTRISEDGNTESIEFYENPQKKDKYQSSRISSVKTMNGFGLNGYLGERVRVKEGVARYVEKRLYFDEEFDDGCDDGTYYAWELE